MAMHTVDPMKALEERKARKRGGLALGECFSPDRKRAKLERFEADVAMIVTRGVQQTYVAVMYRMHWSVSSGLSDLDGEVQGRTTIRL